MNAPTDLDALPLALTVEEAAALLRIGRSAAYAAVDRGEIPAVRIGRRLRVPRHALAAMLGVEDGDVGADVGTSPDGAVALQAVDGASDSLSDDGDGGAA